MARDGEAATMLQNGEVAMGFQNGEARTQEEGYWSHLNNILVLPRNNLCCLY